MNGRSYVYTVTSADTLDSIRNALVAQLNNDPQVTATAASMNDRIVLSARVQGPDGEGISIGAGSSGGSLS